MPPPRIVKPEFSPYGKYIIDIDARRIALAERIKPVFHNSENIKPECDLNNIKTSAMSRFNNIGWALQRGFARCEHCTTA